MTSPQFASRLDGPAPENDIARDIVLKRALPALPVILVVAALPWGLTGAVSAGDALALVCLNFLLAAALMSWSAKISLTLMMGVVLGGYILRLGLLVLAVVPFRHAGWMQIVPFAITLGVSHLGLLLWELRHVAGSLAYPGLKPTTNKD
ncbi:MAG: hypothetical protein JWO68_939 [Actinomycetia bacterium]|nr:hypothetical protein [Actinomycetes bacterium]